LKSKKVVKRAAATAVTQSTATKTENTPGLQKLNLVIRADTLGSLEAIKESLAKFAHPEVTSDILQSGLGNITEADVLRAETSNALLLGFNVIATPSAESVARGKHLKITTYDVIYDLIDDVKKELEKLLKPEVIETELGRVKILGVFRT